jgi:hypothetical protein
LYQSERTGGRLERLLRFESDHDVEHAEVIIECTDWLTERRERHDDVTSCPTSRPKKWGGITPTILMGS